MKTQTEQLPFRKIKYPSLKRLPNGCMVVTQDGYKGRKGWAKFGVYSKSKFLICLTGWEKSKPAARKYAVISINRQLREAALLSKDSPDFNSILRKIK